MLIYACKPEPPAQDSQWMELQKTLDLPKTPYDYTPVLPGYFQNQFIRIIDNTPPDNPVTNWGATLGRVLFYDKQLSLNHTVSCASCHKQQFGFADTARFSKGLHGGATARHSMGLANAAYYKGGGFFWDERAATLEQQTLMPIQDAVEMGMTLPVLIERLSQTKYYPALFKRSFGDEQITEERISKALAQFVRAIISYRSKFDSGRAMVASADQPFPNYTTEENRGKNIFFNHNPVNCAGCHNTETFSMDFPRNNGLGELSEDKGVFTHTQDPLDIGKFKAPSLKNISLRKHFMHDGSFTSLEEVIEHYSSGITMSPTLDAHLVSNGQAVQKNLSNDEKKALLAFLRTLTDFELVKDEKFTSPFR